jgi:hypothetical protein
VITVNLLLLVPVSRKILLHLDDIVRFSLLKSLIISPLGFYQDLAFMPYQLFFSFIISTIILCVFILMSKNIARIMFIFFQCGIIVFGLVIMALFFAISQQSRMYWIFDTFIRICLFPAIYCAFFSLPKVREQFKGNKLPMNQSGFNIGSGRFRIPLYGEASKNRKSWLSARKASQKI